MLEARERTLHSCVDMAGPDAPSSSVPLSSCCSPWQDCEQGTVSRTGWLLGSSRESVGGGEGESVPGSETGGSAAPSSGALLRLRTFLLSSLRSTLSARRSLSSRWTFPCRASKSWSRTDFWTGKRHRAVQLPSCLADINRQQEAKHTSSAISTRALLLLSHRERYMAVSFSSFLIFLVIWIETKPSRGAQITQSSTSRSHLLHLLFKGGEHLVALG